MRRLLRALDLYLGTKLTWRTAWKQAAAPRRYEIVSRDGFLYIEPR